MRILVSLLALLGLTACFDAELVLDFKDEANVETTLISKMTRSVYDVSTLDGSDPCEGGSSTLDEESFACIQTAEMTIDQAIVRPNPFGKEGNFDPSEGLAIERLGDNTLRVTVDLGKLDSPENRPEELKGMSEIAAAPFAGHSIIYRVRGYKILETNGTLAEDGKEASLVVPIPGLITGKFDVVSPFTTTVQLTKHCAFLGLFCD